ncbi:aminomethyl-transferring glycine dehydrogenase [Microbacterium alcoholitolerans]|uniref:aminomethyl-transferring glycine dehydrogenase n=1 Tax=unclassified Microbacterium TaxID=2609290 RepID=UPI003D170E22
MRVTSFADRHIGITSEAQRHMLDALGVHGDDPVEVLMRQAVPDSIYTAATEQSSIPAAASEAEALAELRALANRNTVNRAMIGLGYHGTFTPSVIQRNVLENPSWYTAYTPYQPEISQGRLEALINFQTMVSDLAGLTTANSSMLDESTAVAEAMLLARRASKSKSNVFVVDADALPQTKALLATRAEAVGVELVERDLAGGEELPEELFGVLVQYPGASGRVWDPSAVFDAAHVANGIAIAAADLLALTLLRSPGSLGADVAVGTTQRFGVPMAFGGPHAGYMSVRAGLERQLPGRLVGVSQDAVGYPAYRLALQTREQHIRREKATSNICTAQVLLAVMASMYAVYHGPDGLRAIAQQVATRARLLKTELDKAGVEVVHDAFFDTVQVRTADAAGVVARAHEAGFLLRLVDAETVAVSVDETTTVAEVLRVANLLGASGGAFGFVGGVTALPEALLREDEYLTHPVFHVHRSETAMMRYLKQLADRDYALDRGMIPLGSCTMKLNAATEMAAITWPEFAQLHPFAPREDVDGSLAMIDQLEGWLAEVTGYDAVSLQPNAGSQGELAGLLAIRGYHHAGGDAHRTVCLIPSSAHGTNAASAVLAGMKVVVVATDELGNVDLDDLHAKIAQHAENLSALMITYPSTHGVYEEQVTTITAAVHEAGGQVYVDGANLNALLGYARFGDLGGDVSHLNLHKTFAIPHGGGGPGVGPVAAKAHLAPYLPGHPQAQSAVHSGGHVFEGGPVSGAPYGSAGVLPISWAYVRMMGPEGLRDATAAAVLSANYIAARLAEHYPVLYSGEQGRVAHECILDLRPLKDATGITVDDVAKRLIDYGFHAPTMSFPVAGTLMVEPTESEDLGEVDRFIEAMIQIKAEADAVAAGTWPADDNPLVNAPHTAESLIAGEWQHAYPREVAAYPVRSLIAAKYWPPVRRIDQAYGDRNLVCACPPIEAFA